MPEQLTEKVARARAISSVKSLMDGLTIPAGYTAARYLQELTHQVELTCKIEAEEAKQPPLPELDDKAWAVMQGYLLDGGGSHHVDELLRLAEAALAAGDQPTFWAKALQVYKALRLQMTFITGAAPR